VYDLENELRYNSPKLLTVNDSELRNKRSSLETELRIWSTNQEFIEARKSATKHEENGLMYLALGLLSLGSTLFGGQLISWRKENEREEGRQEYFKQRDLQRITEIKERRETLNLPPSEYHGDIE